MLDKINISKQIIFFQFMEDKTPRVRQRDKLLDQSNESRKIWSQISAQGHSPTLQLPQDQIILKEKQKPLRVADFYLGKGTRNLWPKLSQVQNSQIIPLVSDSACPSLRFRQPRVAQKGTGKSHRLLKSRSCWSQNTTSSLRFAGAAPTETHVICFSHLTMSH